MEMKHDVIELKDAEFMTAKEKGLVLRDWGEFLKALLNDCNERKENVAPESNARFTKRLYEHLHLHCSFIAHYDRAGFYSTYFDNPNDTITFLKQFDADTGCMSAEIGMSYWLNGDYGDVNRLMCAALDEHKGSLYEKLKSRERSEDLEEAERIAGKWGFVIRQSQQ